MSQEPEKYPSFFDSEISFLGLDPEEIAPDTEKDVCYGVIYNSESKTVEMETAHLPVYRGRKRATRSIF